MRPVDWIATLMVATTGVLASCDQPLRSVPAPTLDEVFQLAEVIELGEQPVDSIAEIGVFVERRDGGFIIADRLLPRVRAYSEDGSLEAAFGRFGNGPWEFREIIGVTEMPSGRVVVASPRNPWLTFLKRDLTPDTILAVNHLVGDLFALREDIVFFGLGPLSGETVTSPELARQRGFYHRLVDGEVTWSAWRSPVFDKPYMDAFTGMPATVAGDSIYVMASVLYPATIINGAGDSVGTIGLPSPSFREIPDIPRGYFATEQGGPKMARLLASFDNVARIDVVGDDYLVFTIGHMDETKPVPPFRGLHTRLEVYNRHTGGKLYKDILLPQGARVLGGGRHLYILQNSDFPPWRIAKHRLVAGH